MVRTVGKREDEFQVTRLSTVESQLRSWTVVVTSTEQLPALLGGLQPMLVKVNVQGTLT